MSVGAQVNSITLIRAFLISVVPPPEVRVRSIAPGEICLSWSSVPNTGYSVEQKRDLSDKEWIATTFVMSTDAETTVTINNLGREDAFYRIRAAGNLCLGAICP